MLSADIPTKYYNNTLHGKWKIVIFCKLYNIGTCVDMAMTEHLFSLILHHKFPYNYLQFVRKDALLHLENTVLIKKQSG